MRRLRRLGLEGLGYQPVKFPVDGIPSPTPPPPADTTLTQTCPGPEGVVFNQSGPTTITVTGTLSAAPPGSPVAVTFTHPNRAGSGPPVAPTETVEATTNGDGTWTASVSTTDRQDVGEWSVSSSYAGTDAHKPSQAGPCSFSVILD